MTARRKRSKDTSGELPGKFHRTSAWAGVNTGDVVEVIGTGIRSAKWEFVAHVRNVVTGDEWVEVVGGKVGDRKLRSFHPERVFAPAKKVGKSRARSSLADEPRLPLG